MEIASRRFREFASAALAPPDEIMLEIGASGELLVAQLRVLIASMLLLLPLAHAVTGGGVRETMVGLGAAVLINAFALAWLQLARRRRRYSWLPFATAGFDVTASTQVQRLVLLAIITLVTAMVVYRMQRLVEFAGTDGLTRLPNRAWLLHRAPRLISEAPDDGGSLTLALIDMDYFRRINEEAGHHAGDRALRHVVGIVKGLLARSEWLVRLGGEEFVLVLHQPVGSAWERVDAIRRQVAAQPFQAERGHEPMVLTFSAGLASYPHDGPDLSRLLHRSNRRLQAAKREGRNRVIARDE